MVIAAHPVPLLFSMEATFPIGCSQAMPEQSRGWLKQAHSRDTRDHQWATVCAFPIQLNIMELFCSPGLFLPNPSTSFFSLTGIRPAWLSEGSSSLSYALSFSFYRHFPLSLSSIPNTFLESYFWRTWTTRQLKWVWNYICIINTHKSMDLLVWWNRGKPRE